MKQKHFFSALFLHLLEAIIHSLWKETEEEETNFPTFQPQEQWQANKTSPLKIKICINRSKEML